VAGTGAGLAVPAEVEVEVVVVAPESAAGSVPVVWVPVVWVPVVWVPVVSVPAGALPAGAAELPVSGVGEAAGAGVVVVEPTVAELEPGQLVLAPAVANVGVVGWASTVASVWVWVRPGGTLGVALACAGVVCLPRVLAATELCAVVAVVLAGGAGLCTCLTTGGRCGIT
jgi:hypothetical protein